MCGIFGVFFHDSGRVPDEEMLRASARLLLHRGPDAQGTYAQAGVGLAHTRLSIVDLNPRSNQPFWDNSHEYCLVYNGEIYNFPSLRADLESLGIAFRTSSDTEVLLEALIHFGVDDTLSKLDGMFAFAFFDKKDESLVLVRDHFGIKPLFVYDGDDQFVFASEIRALRPWITFEADVLSISAYLQSGVWPGNFSTPTKNHSFYKNVRIVPPGSKIEVRRGRRAEWGSYFSLHQLLDPPERNRLKRLSPNAVVDELEMRLQASVNAQLIADAPVGALCGGGVDSSLILAIASKSHSNLAIFHADVEHCSEYDAARALAKHLKLDLQSVKISEQAILDNLVDVTEHFGHPFMYHPSCIPFFLVSKLVRDHGVKAVLTGEGADECFVGYPWKVQNLRHRLKRFLKKLVKPTNGDADANGRRHVVDLHNRCEMAFERSEIRAKHKELFGQQWTEQDLVSFDLLGYHLRTLLHRNDSLGMAASVESRFPLLARDVVRLAVNMPYSLKIRFSPTSRHEKHPFLIDKWIFRRVAARYIPSVMHKRPKMGFHVPAVSRIEMKTDFFADSFIAELFDLSRLEMNYFIAEADRELMQKLVFLELWGQVCLHDAPREIIRHRVESCLSIARVN